MCFSEGTKQSTNNAVTANSVLFEGEGDGGGGEEL